MLYICMYNEGTKEIEYAEAMPFGTDEEKAWAAKWGNRLELECRARGEAAGWTPYMSEEKQFSFEKAVKK